MDPELLRALGYGAFNPPGFMPRRPQLPMFRPSVDVPPEAYGGTVGLGEAAGATVAPTPTPSGPGIGPSIMSWLSSGMGADAAPALSTTAAPTTPLATDALATPPALPSPSQYQEPYRSQPMPTVEDYRTQPYQAPTFGQPAALGAMLEPPVSGVPLPRPRPAEAPGGPSGPTPANVKGMTDALKGVIAPPAPSSQKVGTPHPPAMGKLQGGNVAELLASLGIGPQQAFPGLKLPSTLGQALGGR